jgi:hypothetical protein
MATNTNNHLSSGGEVFMNNKPVVRVAALSGVKRPLSACLNLATPAPVTTSSASAQSYHMIQIGGDVFKVATAASPTHADNIDVTKRNTFDRKYYGEMTDGPSSTMVVAKSEKADNNTSNDESLSSDDASDLSLQLEDARCGRTSSTSSGLTAIVQGPDGQFFVPVHTLGSSINNNIVINGDFTASSGIEDISSKRELRLLKNREAAKECRRKKKDYVRCLENRVALLENQNKTLINELKSLKELYCQKEAHT